MHIIFSYIIGALIGIALFYVGGWNIIWDLNLSIFLSKSFILNNAGFMFLFNDLYYGVEITSRFFDSPLISWICFGLGISSLTGGGFIGGYFENTN